MPGLTHEKPTKGAEHTSRFQPTSGPAPGIYGECRPKSVIGAEPVPVGFSRHPDVRPGFQSGAAPSDCRIEYARTISQHPYPGSGIRSGVYPGDCRIELATPIIPRGASTVICVERGA